MAYSDELMGMDEYGYKVARVYCEQCKVHMDGSTDCMTEYGAALWLEEQGWVCWYQKDQSGKERWHHICRDCDDENAEQ